MFCRDGVQLGRKILFEPKQRRLEMICVENVIPRLRITYMYLIPQMEGPGLCLDVDGSLSMVVSSSRCSHQNFI